MKKSLLIVPALLLMMSGYSLAADEDDVQALSGAATSPGLFCNVESAQVCVVARTEEDCTKLGGEKVETCPSSQEDE